MKPYKEILNKVEATLRSQSKCSEEEFNSYFAEYKNYENQSFSDDDYFNKLILTVFYSGFKAETVDNKSEIIKNYFPNHNSVASYDKAKVSDIMNDVTMIKYEKKIKACINNAKVLKDIIEKHGSFQNYVNSFKPKDSFENLMLFKEEIEYKFSYLGRITSYHFMTDIGLPVLKPDRVITRIFKRIGLIENEEQLLKTVIQGRKFSQETEYPIRYIDIIFVRYGQKGKDYVLDDGICLENKPKCHICGIKQHCDYYTTTVGMLS